MRDAAGEPADRFHLLRLPQLRFTADHIATPFGALAGIANRSPQQFGVGAILDQVVLGAALDRLHSGDIVVCSGQHDQRQEIPARGMQTIDGLEPVAVGQREIQQHGVESIGSDRGNGGSDRRDLLDFHPDRSGGELGAHQRRIIVVVFDEQYANHRRRSG